MIRLNPFDLAEGASLCLAGRRFLGFVSPLNITPQDHEGGGYLRVYQVKGREWVPVSGWIRGYRDEVMALVKGANAK